MYYKRYWALKCPHTESTKIAVPIYQMERWRLTKIICPAPAGGLPVQGQRLKQHSH